MNFIKFDLNRKTRAIEYEEECEQIILKGGIMELILGFLFLLFFFYTLFEGPIKRRKKERMLIQANMNEVDNMTGQQFEEYLYVVFKKLKYNAQITKQSGDFGADLILIKNNRKIIVQAKRYKGKVPIKAIQEVVGAKVYYKADELWSVTNSYFTDPAKQLARLNNVKLIEREQLAELILATKQSS